MVVIFPGEYQNSSNRSRIASYSSLRQLQLSKCITEGKGEKLLSYAQKEMSNEAQSLLEKLDMDKDIEPHLWASIEAALEESEGRSRLEHDDCILNNYGVGVPFGIFCWFW